MDVESAHRNDFKTFDPISYLEMRYRKTTDQYRFIFPLQKYMYHEFFTQTFSKCEKNLRILEYGCGPVIMHLISAVPVATEIVMADKVPECLQEVDRWVNGNPQAFDWTAHFDHVVQILEGKGEREAREREKELRKAIKATVQCDIFQDSPIEAGYEGPYDIVMSNQCIDGASKSLKEFQAGVAKLAQLLKPGGRLTMITNSNINLGRSCTYSVGESGEKFPSVGITREFLTATLESIGFMDLHVDACEHGFKEAIAAGTVGSWAQHQPDDFIGYLFVCGTKKP
jgi:SAM-dependent methyltransferase